MLPAPSLTLLSGCQPVPTVLALRYQQGMAGPPVQHYHNVTQCQVIQAYNDTSCFAGGAIHLHLPQTTYQAGGNTKLPSSRYHSPGCKVLLSNNRAVC
jgi:hypothetical protein